MQNKHDNKEVITIKVLAGAAALNILAAGFTLMYKNTKTGEISQQPVTTEIGYSDDMSAPKPTLGPPYMPGLTEDGPATVPITDEMAEKNPLWYEVNNGTLTAPTEITAKPDTTPTPQPTLGPPYIPGLTEDGPATVPITDEMAEKNPLWYEVNNGTLPAPTEIESNSIEAKPTLGPPYIPGLTEDDLHTGSTAKPTVFESSEIELNPPYIPGLTESDISGKVPITDEIREKNPIYYDINDGTISAPTEITAESMVRSSQNPIYDVISENETYISNDSDEHTRSRG